jgi:hypothetical protein
MGVVLLLSSEPVAGCSGGWPMLPFLRDFLLTTQTYVGAFHLLLRLCVRRHNLPLEGPLEHPRAPHKGLPREVKVGCPTRTAIAPALNSATASPFG